MKADAFALLGLPRRAGLAAAEVRAAFQKRGAEAHPDGAEDAAGAGARTSEFAALNDAQATLSSMPRRLRHLLELEYPEFRAPATGTVLDSGMMDLFAAAGAALNAAAAFQQRRRGTTTALARALLAGDEMKTREAIETALEQVGAAIAALDIEIAETDQVRASGGDAAARLQSCAARAGFLEKWQAKMREAFTGLLGD